MKTLKKGDIAEILEVKRDHVRTKSDPDCPICGQTLGDSTLLVVMDREGEIHEAHADCCNDIFESVDL